MADAVSVALDGVTKRFGATVAVDDVTLRLPGGSLTALVGPSGCGKSTLLRLVAGFERPDAGAIAIGGDDVTGRPLRERHVGFVFQSYALFPHLDVAGNVGFPLSVRGESRERVTRRVGELLELVRLPGLERRRPHQLSGGQRQRVALARALAADPSILLLDEPFAALDHHVRRDLRRWLRRLHDEVHVTTVLVTHDAEEAMEIADAVVLMNAGRIEQSGTPHELYDAPVSPFALQFLGPANEIAAADGMRYVRPHELRLHDAPVARARNARVTRVVRLGSRVRYEVALEDGLTIEVDEPAHGRLRSLDERVHVAPIRERRFAEAAP